MKNRHPIHHHLSNALRGPLLAADQGKGVSEQPRTQELSSHAGWRSRCKALHTVKLAGAPHYVRILGRRTPRIWQPVPFYLKRAGGGSAEVAEPISSSSLLSWSPIGRIVSWYSQALATSAVELSVGNRTSLAVRMLGPLCRRWDLRLPNSRAGLLDADNFSFQESDKRSSRS